MQSPKVIGIVFDLSGQLGPDKRRFLDTVPAAVAQFMSRLLDDQDVVYVYSTQSLEPCYVKGQQIAAISGFQMDGSRFNIHFALVQTMYVLCAEDPDLERIVIYITDRCNSNNATDVRKALDRNERESLECRLVIIGIGNCYDDAALVEVFPDFHHVDAAEHLIPLLMKEIPQDV